MGDAMSDDLVKRLKDPPFGTETSERNLMAQAAARIAELEAERDDWNEGWQRAMGQFDQKCKEANKQRARAEAAEAQVAAASDTFYIDCEFDGHNGPLLSIAMVRGDGWSLHVEVEGVAVADPWVLANVTPIMGAHQADISRRVRADEVGGCLREFIGDCQRPKIIADSPVDIARFCRAISTGEDGGWAPSSYPGMTFAVENVDCYPTKLSGAVQHNAWWDAMALRIALAAWEAAK